MLFNSRVFAVFFPTVLALYWCLPLRLQNLLLLVASYVFYGYWDWRFLSLIAVSTLVDYVAGLQIENARTRLGDAARPRMRRWLWLSVCTNLGILGFFKYFDFFSHSFADLLSALGWSVSPLYLNVLLPVGISFYTFQTMSYTIDIYRGEMKPTRRLLEFAVYVAFFPQLVAGPIERARELLPRILNRRVFRSSQLLDGLHLIFWGLFKKVYVADNLAPLVDEIFQAREVDGFAVLVGAYTFAWQIYCDFSGYSDIARGCAKCLGIELMLNFNHPYLADNPRSFWQRWHISLSTWLRDYLYVPLGGNRGGTLLTYRNLALTMLLGGLWHGASWVFVLWGGYQGLLLIAHRVVESRLPRPSQRLAVSKSRLVQSLKIIAFFHLVCLGWIVFRATSLTHVFQMLHALFYWTGGTDWSDWSLLTPLLTFAGPLICVEAVQVSLSRDDLNNLSAPLWLKSATYAAFFYLLVFHGATSQSFIYFQF